MFIAAARSAFRHAPYTDGERATLQRIFRCQRSRATLAHERRARRLLRRHLANFKRGYRYRQAVIAVTPYVDPFGRRWAIPYPIVRCESTTRAEPRGGDWHVANSIGARGPYQLLDKPDPWPVRSRADRLAHHRIAYRLWAGGRGAHHWSQCL